MKTKRIFFQWAVWGMVLVFAVGGQAVTEQEIQKIQEAMPDKPVVQPTKSRTMLVFTLCNGFKHGCIPYWTKAMEIMGQKTGAFKIVHSEDMGVFSADSLKQFDVICLNNTTKLTPDDAQKKAIMDFVKSGKGIVGIHAATDNFYEWNEGAMMMGGVFKGHPWLSNGTWAVKIDEPDHPLMKSFKGKGFKINDEIYRTLPPQYSRANQRVLMSLDMSDPTTKNAKGVTPDDMDTGISWIKSVGKGRLFYCSLGHNNHLTWNRPVLEHYLAGIQYAMGDLEVDDTPLVKFTDTLDPLIAQLRQYDWDKSRAVPAQLHTLIEKQYGNPGVLKAIEAKLLGVLEPNVSMAVKDFICRELSVIGTEQSLPVLAEMLADEKTTNIARYALENIPGNAVDEILIQTLAESGDRETKIGIVTSLGIRQSAIAVTPLTALAKGDDDDIARAAISALGMTGSVAAADALESLIKSSKYSSRKVPQQDALLGCYSRLLKNDGSGGNLEKARRVYEKLYAEGNPPLIRAAALRQLIQTHYADSGKLLLAAVQDENAAIQTAAIGLLSDFDDEQVLKTIAADMSDLSDSAKVQLMAALAENPQKIGTEQILKQKDSPNKAVRLEACRSLGKLGDESVIKVLAVAAATAQDRQLREAAQTALYQLPGKEVDAAILRKISTADKTALDENETAELIRATVQRQIAEAPEVLFRVAMSSRRRVASEAVRALQSLAGPDYMEEWVSLLISKPNKNTENAIIVVAQKISEPDSRANRLMDKYASMADNEKVKISMLRVMGKLGDEDTILLLRREYTSLNENIKTAAFRAMTDWPGDDFINEMKTIAQKSKDNKTRILAFRAYVRMLTEADGQNREVVVGELIEAFEMAPRPDEKKIVIGAVGGFASEESLVFVTKIMDNPELRTEAEVSVVSICEKLPKSELAAARSLLEKINKTTTNEALKKRTEQLLK